MAVLGSFPCAAQSIDLCAAWRCIFEAGKTPKSPPQCEDWYHNTSLKHHAAGEVRCPSPKPPWSGWSTLQCPPQHGTGLPRDTSLPPWALLIPESYPSHLQAVFLDFMSWVFPWPDLKSTERGHQDAKLHGAGGLCRLCFFISAPHASLTSLTKPKEHFP